MSDEVLARIGRFRQAARLVVASPVAVRDRCLALLDIVDMARAEPDPLVRVWAERAVWEECKAFLGMDDFEVTFPLASFGARVRWLRAQGYTACPTCDHRLPTEGELEHWSDLRRQHAEMLAAREGAVSP